MLKKVAAPVLIVVVTLVGMLLLVAALQPNEYSITRSMQMEAAPTEVFAQVNDFRNWEGWSPWAELDPNAKYAFSGPPAGEGAKFAWVGNNNMGEGDMTITESKPHELVKYKLHFVKPFEDTCESEFTFEPVGSQTQVTWTMHGKKPFMNKLICLFMNMDQMVGGSFEKGLSSMKAIVEAEKKPETDTKSADEKKPAAEATPEAAEAEAAK